MKNFKYAYLSISKKIFLNFVIMLQVIIASFIIYSSLKVSGDIINDSNRILNIFNDKKAYYMKISSDFLYRLDNNQITNKNIIEAYKFLKNNEFTHFYCREDAVLVKSFDGIEKFRSNPSTKNINNTQYIPVNEMFLDKEMYNQFKLKLIQGKDFTKEDFESETDKIPVILGYDYREKYKVGDTFEYYSSKEKKTKLAEVIGILQQDSYLLYKVDYSSKFNNLNNYVITPFVDLDKLPVDSLIEKHYYQVFDLFNTSYFLFDKSKSDSEMSNIVKAIDEKFAQLGIGQQNIENVDSYLNLDKEMLAAQKHNSIILSFIIIIFLSIGIVSSLLYSIKKEKRYYGIHIMNGATLNDICIRLFEQTLITFFIGFAASIGFIKSNFKSIEIKLVIEIIILLFILAVFTSVLPILKIRRLNVNELMKDGE